MRIQFRDSFRLSPFDSILLRRVISIFAILLPLMACAPVSPTAEEDRALFERLCNAPERIVVNKTVAAEGFFDFSQSGTIGACPGFETLRKVFFEQGYKHYECITDKNPKPVEESHILRFELKPFGHAACIRPEIRRYESSIESWRQQFDYLGTLCIGVEDLREPASQYARIHDRGRVSPEGKHQPGHPPNYREIPGYIRYSRIRIVDRVSDEILAEKRFYAYYPFGANFLDISIRRCTKGIPWKTDEILKPSR